MFVVDRRQGNPIYTIVLSCYQLQEKVVALEQTLSKLVKDLDTEKQRFKDSIQRQVDKLV